VGGSIGQIEVFTLVNKLGTSPVHAFAAFIVVRRIDFELAMDIGYASVSAVFVGRGCLSAAFVVVRRKGVCTRFTVIGRVAILLPFYDIGGWVGTLARSDTGRVDVHSVTSFACSDT